MSDGYSFTGTGTLRAEMRKRFLLQQLFCHSSGTSKQSLTSNQFLKLFLFRCNMRQHMKFFGIKIADFSMTDRIMVIYIKVMKQASKTQE